MVRMICGVYSEPGECRPADPGDEDYSLPDPTVYFRGSIRALYARLQRHPGDVVRALRRLGFLQVGIPLRLTAGEWNQVRSAVEP